MLGALLSFIFIVFLFISYMRTAISRQQDRQQSGGYRPMMRPDRDYYYDGKRWRRKR